MVLSWSCLWTPLWTWVWKRRMRMGQVLASQGNRAWRCRRVWFSRMEQPQPRWSDKHQAEIEPGGSRWEIWVASGSQWGWGDGIYTSSRSKDVQSGEKIDATLVGQVTHKEAVLSIVKGHTSVVHLILPKVRTVYWNNVSSSLTGAHVLCFCFWPRVWTLDWLGTTNVLWTEPCQELPVSHQFRWVWQLDPPTVRKYFWTARGLTLCCMRVCTCVSRAAQVLILCAWHSEGHKWQSLDLRKL